MHSSGERTHVYLYLYRDSACAVAHVYLYIYRDSASVESTRGGSLTLAPITCTMVEWVDQSNNAWSTSRMLEHYGASVSEVADNTEARSQ